MDESKELIRFLKTKQTRNITAEIGDDPNQFVDFEERTAISTSMLDPRSQRKGPTGLEPTDIPDKYAELDHIEDGHAVIIVYRPERTDELTGFPPVERTARATVPADNLPDAWHPRDRFRIVPPADADRVVITDGGDDLGLRHDPQLTESVRRLTETA